MPQMPLQDDTANAIAILRDAEAVQDAQHALIQQMLADMQAITDEQNKALAALCSRSTF